MPLSKLQIFSKNRDANESLKGYEYQKLKTLELWLYNNLNGIDEVIFCEYEDDIFSRNIDKATATFKQLKLYGSKSFSFKSEEIRKAMSHFFLLFIKGEYKFDVVEFVFETNTKVAKEYADNDGELLGQWINQQGHLSKETLIQLLPKIISIVTEYIESVYPYLLATKKSDAQEALINFKNIGDEVWTKFCNSIKLKFTNQNPEEALTESIAKIKALIDSLPNPNLDKNTEAIFTSLYYEVSTKMFQKQPDERKLTPGLLESILLNNGSESDQQYGYVRKAWDEVQEVITFTLGEFLEVLDAAKHCRRSIYLKGDTEVWISLLSKFIANKQTPIEFNRSAIYESVWLALKAYNKFEQPTGGLIGYEGLIEQYFQDIKNFTDYRAVEDALNLLQIVQAAIAYKKCLIASETIDYWRKELHQIIDTQIEKQQDESQVCYFLELKAHLLFNPFEQDNIPKRQKEIFACYDKILKLIPEANLYDVTRLGNRINDFINVLIHIKDSDLIELFEGLSEKLMPFIGERKGSFGKAKMYIDKGVSYLKSTDRKLIAKALSFFHKAKDLFYLEETSNGYVLALLNISQLYAAIKMNLAAKYYAMSAVWFSLYNNPQKHIGKLSDAYGMIFYSDFQQGAWLSAINDFNFVLSARFEFGPNPYEAFDKSLAKKLNYVTTILFCSPQISSQLTYLIEHVKKEFGDVYAHLIVPLESEFDETIGKKITIEDFLAKKIDYSPINDIGPTRKIAWSAFGTNWEISFENSWYLTALGEEFASILQILLVELSLINMDLLLIRTNVKVQVVFADKWSQPEQLPSNSENLWKVSIPKIESTEKVLVVESHAHLLLAAQHIVSEVSLLSNEASFEMLTKLLKEEGLATKALTSNLYQKIYRGLFPKSQFDKSQRSNFISGILNIRESENEIMTWNSSISDLYSTEDSFGHIESRYENLTRAIHLTTSHIKQDPKYSDFIKRHREDGWLDWQIEMAILNYIVSQKATLQLQGIYFDSKDKYLVAMAKACDEIKDKDEKETYVQFELSDFMTVEFELCLYQVVERVANTWGLHNKVNFPNLKAMRDFLNFRFNFNVDDIPALSIL